MLGHSKRFNESNASICMIFHKKNPQKEIKVNILIRQSARTEDIFHLTQSTVGEDAILKKE